MQKIREFEVDTADWRFYVEVFRKSDGNGFIAEYWGTKPKVAPSPPPGEPAATLRASSPKPISLEDSDLDQLITRCKQAIAQGYGELMETEA